MSSQVRVEYGWLAEETRFLVATFNFDLSEQCWLDHDRLMDGCECLDRVVDEAPDEERALLAGLIIEALRQGESEHEAFSTELTRQLNVLNDIFGRYPDPEFFISRAERIFQIAETVRSVRDRGTYIELVCEEGRCFLEMFLPIFEVSAPESFMSWFPSVAEVGNLVDKLVDARADYRRGEMALYPGLGHHLALLSQIAWRGKDAFRFFPSRTRLFLWAIRFFNPRRHVSAWLG